MYKLAPVVLVESLTKDTTTALALSLDELGLIKSGDDEIWEEDSEQSNNKMRTFFERTNQTYENLIEKLKHFKANDIQVPFVTSSLANYKNIQNATLVQVNYNEIQAISTKQFQKNPQFNLEFSFVQLWSQITGQAAHIPFARNKKFVQ